MRHSIQNMVEEELSDAEIIDLVRQGQKEHFKVLIQRYQNRVFAVAWSRLGDRALAEETVQETFIQGYRSLGQVRKPDRFAQWITAIARRRAIQLGIRHQNEIRKREQWALDSSIIQTSTTPTQTIDPDEEQETDQSFKEALQDCMGSLTGVHRECLSLYYLQGKKIQEAAATLGVSENTFKVRLHRARKALRSSMESVLESGLQKLRPSDKIRHSIMAVVLGKGTGSSLVKSSGMALQTLPGIGTLIFGIQILAMLPGFLLARWFAKMDIANFRDQGGYQVQIYKQNIKAGLTFCLIGFAFILLFFQGIPTFSYLSILYLLMIIYTGIMLINYRYMRYWASPMLIVFNLLIIAFFHLYLFHGLINLGLIWVGQGAFFVYLAHHIRNVEPRMDFSIFLRLHHQAEQSNTEPLPPLPARMLPASTGVLRAFADFIARDRGVMKDRKIKNGLELWITPIRFSPLTFFGSIGLTNSSKIILRSDGTVQAKFGKKDQKQLESLEKTSIGPDQIEKLESRVSKAVEGAFHFWASGDASQARKLLAFNSNSSVFIQPHKESKGGKSKYRVHLSFGCVFLLLGLFKLWVNPYGLPERQMRYKPVETSESEIRQYFKDIDQLLIQEEGKSHKTQALQSRMRFSMVILPPADMVGPQLMHTLTNAQPIVSLDFNRWLENPEDGNLLIRGIKAASPTLGYHSYTPLPSDLGKDYSGLLKTMDPDWNPLWIHRFGKDRSSSKKLNELELKEAFHILGILRNYMGLDSFDWSKVHQDLSSYQYLDPDKPFKNHFDFDIEGVLGLIVVGQYPMVDTWRALQILEWTGGLDQIDREACIEGILDLHFGKGRFYAKLPSSPSSPWVNATAPTTYAAFHSLRILNTLEQVGDLEKWKFRPRFQRDPTKTKAIDSHFYYQEIEAWLMQKELEEFLKNRSG